MRHTGWRNRTSSTTAKRPPCNRGWHADEQSGETMTAPDLAAQDVIDPLDRFYCHNVVVALWADAVANRLHAAPSSCLVFYLPTPPNQRAPRPAHPPALATSCA